AEAAVLDGKQAIQTQSYGPEARGGSSRAEVIIADEPIDYPKVLKADTLLAMSQEAFDKYGKGVGAEASLVVDSTFVRELSETKAKIVSLPITKAAKDELGRDMFANIIALGAIVGLTKTVSRESLVAAVLARVPKGTEDKNRKAIDIGFALVKDVQ
ncbi:MAG TPA: 2-oxoacid:acceptor oxidoreductase family protein, partial [Negativicutes bacterium]|nr:2-oxoacid:acceptor oxidoreductase family protein [Negativicutes bacterium]